MDVIRRFSKPVLRRPRAVISFEGWNDAGEAASGAAEYLLASSRATEPFAVIDPEEFYDFQVRRPQVSIDAGGTRSLTWPMTRFYAVEMASGDRDLVVVLGEEPSFRWRTYARYLTQVLTEVDVEAVVLLGAFAGQVAHTRPVPVIGVATDPALVDRHKLLHSTYEGPTGILAVLQEACREVGPPRHQPVGGGAALPGVQPQPQGVAGAGVEDGRDSRYRAGHHPPPLDHRRVRAARSPRPWSRPRNWPSTSPTSRATSMLASMPSTPRPRPTW